MTTVDLTIRDASLARTRELLSDNENIHPDADFVYDLFDVWDLSMLTVKQDEEFRNALAPPQIARRKMRWTSLPMRSTILRSFICRTKRE